MSDPIKDLQQLAGIKKNQSAAANKDGSLSPVGSNISITGMEKRRLEKEHNIKPGTDEWFRLWFTKPYLTNTSPIDVKKLNKL
jgi:hypothetical protein